MQTKTIINIGTGSEITYQCEKDNCIFEVGKPCKNGLCVYLSVENTKHYIIKE